MTREDQLNKISQENEGDENKETGEKSTAEEEAGELTKEIQSGLGKLEDNTEKLSTIAEDENATPTLKEKLLSSIETIGQNMTAKFKSLMINTTIPIALFGGIKFLAINDAGLSEGSQIDQGNNIALAVTAIFVGIKTMQFAIDKFKQYRTEKGVEKGTIGGGLDALSFINEQSEKSNNGSDITFSETMSLYDEFDESRITPTKREVNKHGFKDAKVIKTLESQSKILNA